MKTGELKKLLSNIPDDYDIIVISEEDNNIYTFLTYFTVNDKNKEIFLQDDIFPFFGNIDDYRKVKGSDYIETCDTIEYENDEDLSEIPKYANHAKVHTYIG